MKVVLAAALLLMLPGPLAAPKRSDTLKLECVNKIGENMYRAKDGTVVWTEHCSHEAQCENATVTLASEQRITWANGEYCWVLRVAARH